MTNLECDCHNIAFLSLFSSTLTNETTGQVPASIIRLHQIRLCLLYASVPRGCFTLLIIVCAPVVSMMQAVQSQAMTPAYRTGATLVGAELSETACIDTIG